MTAELVGEIQQRIDGALFSYREHSDYEDLRQEAWLRLLQAARLGRFSDLRRIARRTARWAAADYFRERHGLDADRQRLTAAGWQVIGLHDLPAALHPAQPDFAPGVVRRLDCEAVIPWRKLSPVDRQILWQVGARGTAMRTVAARIGRHYSFVHSRYHRALRLCRAVAEREARSARRQERAC